MGIGVIGFAKAYERLQPDISLFLETGLSSFQQLQQQFHSGYLLRIYMAVNLRKAQWMSSSPYAITKMSHIHLQLSEGYRKRVIQMGELPENVFCTGAPGLDNIYKLKLINKRSYLICLEFLLAKKTGIVTYHPVTLEGTADKHISELLKAVQRFLRTCSGFLHAGR